MTTFAEALAFYRQRAGLTQSMLARYAGIYPSALSRLQAGTWQPKRETVEALAGALGLSPLEADKLRLAAGFAPCDLVGLVEAGCNGLASGMTPVGTFAYEACSKLIALQWHARDEGTDLNAICRRVGEP